MAKGYKIRNHDLFDTKSENPYKLSRSKIDLFLECPRCFYFDRRFGVERPSIPAFTLNSAVDTLLKKEFDLLRKNGQAHELMKKYEIDAIPYQHPEIDNWRNTLKGVQYLHPETNFLVFGAIDDVWINPKDELLIVDYKSTSTEKEISLEDEYKQGFKRQMEIYQWLFRQNGFKVNETGYFVYANAGRNRPHFDGKLEFNLSILDYKGNDDWLEQAILDAYNCLASSQIPPSSPTCEYSNYRQAFAQTIKRYQNKD